MQSRDAVLDARSNFSGVFLEGEGGRGVNVREIWNLLFIRFKIG